ncbi:MAG: response regulator transcription factor [Balneolaceae bacterium]
MENKDPSSYEEALKRLSVTETRVLDLVEQGLTSIEIAKKLGNSPRTIQTHRNNICRKLGVDGRIGLIKWLWMVRNVKNGG